MRDLGTISTELPASGEPLHERIAMAISEAITSGAIKAGEQLPTHRDLSKRFGVAIGTVTRAVESLRDRGLVRGEVGRGTFVQGDQSHPTKSAVIDLTINAPPQVVKTEVLAAAAENAARRVAELPNAGYIDVTGLPEQRALLASWLAKRKVPAEAADLVLCVGAQQAIWLSFADLRHHSNSIATEAATFTGAIAAAQDLNMKLLAVPHDEEGMIPSELGRVLARERCKIIYSTPVCQNPLGIETGPKRREQIIAVARKHGAFIVEDDIYGIYRTKGDATYRQLAPDIVYYVNSLSKSLTPLIRVGFLIPPRSQRASISERLRATVWGVAPLAVATACALIDVEADAIAEVALRKEAFIRTEAAIKALGLKEVPMPHGQPHIWLPMPLLAAERLARRAAEHGIRLTPPDATLIDPSMASGIRLCILAPKSRYDVEYALVSIASLMSDQPQLTL